MRMASILEPSNPSFFPAMTKIVGTLGPNSRSVEIISSCLKAGMSVARFDFSWGDTEFHQETLENLMAAVKITKKLCAIMLDRGPELQVVNKSEHPITLEADTKVDELKGEDVVCLIKNSATLSGTLYTLHARSFLSKLGELNQTQIFCKDRKYRGLTHFDEILQEADGIIFARGTLGVDLPLEKVFLFQKTAVYKCNMMGKPAVITRVVDSMTDNLRPTRAEATDVANAVLDGSDAILLGAETLRGLYPVETVSTVGKICAELSSAEKVFNQDVYFKKTVKHVGEPMTHLESIASSAVFTFDASAFKLFLFPSFRSILSKQASGSQNFESLVCISEVNVLQVRAAIKVKASAIICFTSSGRAARLIAKYRPLMPVISVVIPRLRTNQLRWTFSGDFEVRQSLIVRGLFLMLADPRHPAESKNGTNESVLKVALEHGKASGVIKPHDRVVVCQKLGDASVVKIIELED
ncbi:Detected protein of confused Function [Hibiscus syriacus]|uniref:pyruvate kinase n=1 Tax=Hibiscus syriacus TaxID=106335 RepID=A0A6A2X8X5_HIBSY|nr:Detected protein of confused Function [Hibiscus syriacus]